MVRNILLTIFFLVIITPILAYFQFNHQVNNEIKTLYSKSISKDNETITEEMLQKLPSPVQRYLRYSGIIGKKKINTVTLKQSGEMKPNPQGKWFPIFAEEYYSIDHPAFIWRARGPKTWLPIIHGRDSFTEGKGRLLIKLISLFPVADAQGEKLDQGAMMRYLNEMMWFPSAFLNDNISWKAIDNNSAEVTLKDNQQSVSAVIYFDDEGKLVNFVAQRYMSTGNDFSLETWETPISEYRQINGYNLPVKGSAIWKLKDGDYKYINITINEIKYN